MASKKSFALDIIIGGAVNKSLKNAIGEVSKQLAGISDKDLKKFGKAAVGVTAGLKAAGKVAETFGAVAGAALKGTYEVAKKSVENASAFQKEMANVSTLLSGTTEEVDKMTQKLTDDVLKISNTTGVATSELNDGLYQVISAFGYTEESARITELAAKSGAAGCATTTDAVNLLSAVTKAYGDTSFEAQQKVSDMAFETVRLGQTSYADLAQNIQKVTSVSSALGVSQEELFGVFAAGTGVVGGAAEVGTQLKAIYTKLQKPTKEMSEAFKAMGYSSAEAAIADRGLQGTLEGITAYSKKTKASLAALYGSSNAASLATALTGNLSGVLTEKTAAMSNASGSTDTAFAKQSGTFDYQVQMIKNLGQNALTEIGLMLLPKLTEIGTNILPIIVENIERILPIVEQIISSIDLGDLLGSIDFSVLGDLVASVLPSILGIIKQLFPLIGKLMPLISPLISAVLQFLPPIVSIIENLMPKLTPMIEGILGILVALTPALTSIFIAAMPIIDNIITGVNFIISVLDCIIPFISMIVSYTSTRFAGITEILSGLGRAFLDIFTNIFLKLSEGIRWLLDKVVSAINWIIGKFNNFVDFANKIKVPDNVPIIGGVGISLNHIPELPQVAFASGGIVTQPTTALIGEGGEPEGVFPLSELERFLDTKPKPESGATYYISFSPNIYVNGGDEDKIGDIMDDEYEKFKRFMDEYMKDNDRVKFEG